MTKYWNLDNPNPVKNCECESTKQCNFCGNLFCDKTCPDKKWHFLTECDCCFALVCNDWQCIRTHCMKGRRRCYCGLNYIKERKVLSYCEKTATQKERELFDYITHLDSTSNEGLERSRSGSSTDCEAD